MIDHFNADIGLSPSDPDWLGAWWLGMLFLAAILLLITLPIAMFPDKIMVSAVSPGDNEQLEKTEPEKKAQQANVIEMLKSHPKGEYLPPKNLK